MKNAFPAASAEDATWYIKGGRALKTPSPFGVMGIVNLTPDSFYDGGVHHRPPAGLEHALALLGQGADILDIGAESSRPGAAELPQDEEIQRLAPVLMGLRRQAPWAAVSVDTYHAATAAAVLEQGAVIINDISACTFDPGLLDVLVQYKPGYVLMHNHGRPETMQHNPHYVDVRHEVREFFERNLARLVRAGLPENRIVLDPGIGFGKTLAHNLELLAHPEDWLGFGRPVLMALSMKSVFGGLLSLPPARRGAATVAATALLRAKGIFWHRVHHVAEARQALKVATAFGKI